jgi:Tfp pilus assembly protein PilV
MKNNIMNNKGFGLLEVLISISVVIIGILPMINLFNSVLAKERDVENKLKAIYFAQEGIEIVRQIRDTNWRQGIDWDYESVSGGSVFDNSEWAISLNNCNIYSGGFKLVASSVDNNKIYKKNSESVYKQACTGGQYKDSGFTRTILIEDIDYNTGGASLNGDYMKITSKVEFNGVELYSLTAYLNKWQN